MTGAAFLAPLFEMARGVREETKNKEGSFAPLWMTTKGKSKGGRHRATATATTKATKGSGNSEGGGKSDKHRALK
jgi:hypothetical protein